MHRKLQKMYKTKRNESELRMAEREGEREREREREREINCTKRTAHTLLAGKNIHSASILRGCCRLLARQT